MPYVGNDVVDLIEQHASPKSLDARFLTRVFVPKEQQLIQGASHPELILWMLWSAKETAYKIMSKIKFSIVFAHRFFVIENFNLERFDIEKGSQQSAFVRYENRRMKILFDWNAERIHAVGALDSEMQPAEYSADVQKTHGSAAFAEDFKQFQSSLTREEKQSIHSEESEWVRYCAKSDVARQMKTDRHELAIIRPTEHGKSQPPYLTKKNVRMDVDLSLSHHGRWVGWVFSLPLIESL